LHEADRVWTRRCLGLLAVLAVWRLLFLVFSPLDLIADEAYYWDWSRRPDWGYFSKPPMVAWVNLITDTLLPATTVTIRLPAVLFGLLGQSALFLLARKMFDAEVGFWAVVALAASPGAVAVNYLMTIDSLLLFAWMAALATLWSALQSPRKTTLWLATGLLIGFGVASKQMMLFFPVLIFFYLFASAEHRPLLRTPGPYLASLVGLASLIPPLLWNAAHDWITFQHTAHHFETSTRGFRDVLISVAEFVVGQHGILSPVTAFLMVLLGLHLTRAWKNHTPATRFLFLFSMPALGVFTLLSFRQSINPNWPAAFVPAATILLAAWAKGHLEGLDRFRGGFGPGIVVGTLMALAVTALPFVFAWTGAGGTSWDPTKRLAAWTVLADEVQEIRQTLPHPDRTFIVAPNRETTSHIAFYLPDQPITFRWPGHQGLVRTQYELWPGPDKDFLGGDGLILLKGDTPLADALRACFESVDPLPPLDIRLGKGQTRTYRVFLGRGLVSWVR